jgi:rhodanese-related sulfurtransferase
LAAGVQDAGVLVLAVLFAALLTVGLVAVRLRRRRFRGRCRTWVVAVTAAIRACIRYLGTALRSMHARRDVTSVEDIMAGPADNTGCACCSTTAPTPDAGSLQDGPRSRFVAGVQALGIDGDDLGELGRLWDAGDCAAVHDRLTRSVAAALTATRTRVVELIEDAARLQTAAAGTLGTPPAVASIQLEITNLGGLAERLQAVAGQLTGPAASGTAGGGCHDGCACSRALSSDPGAGVLLPASRMALTLHAIAAPAVPGPGSASGEPAIVCTLDGGVDAMRGRITEWQAAISRATARDAVDGGVALTFPHDAEHVVELARLAAAEYACCTFFTFTLTVSNAGVRFEVRAPREARDVLTAVFGYAEPTPAAGATPATPATPAVPAAVQRIDRDGLRALLDGGGVVLVEALPQVQYDAEHLPGAVNVPGDLTADVAARLVPALDTTVVVYCSGPGCTRSKTTAAAFTRLGYTDVHVYPGGKADWAEAGLPLQGARATVTA